MPNADLMMNAQGGDRLRLARPKKVEPIMTKTELLLASTALSVLVLWHPKSVVAQASYGSIVVAQEQPREEDQRKHPGQQKRRAVQPGQPATQPAQPPAAQGQPAQPGQPQRPAVVQPGQPPAQPGQPPAARAPVPPPPVAQGQPPQPAQGHVPAPVNAQGQPIRRVEGLRSERREEREGDRIVIREPDRVIVREGGRTIIRHNETDRFRYGARDIRIERRGSENFTIVERPGGVRIVTVTNEDGRLIRRIRRYPDGREVVIIENRWRPGIGVAAGVAGIAAATFFLDLPPPRVHIPRRSYIIETEGATPEEIYGVLMAPPIERLERPYSLEEIRYNAPLRARMPSVDIDTITFETGSWEVSPDQGNRLSVIAQSINRGIETNPSEVFLIEGHTDAVGNEVDNLSLSDRRAEAVALILTEQFQVPPENLTTQGYGEQHLKVPTDGPERANRRVTARRITPLLSGDPGSAGQRAN